MIPCSLLLTCSLLVAQAGTEPVGAPEGEPPSPILIDWIHANDFSMNGLRPGVYDYHATCGFRNGFEYLKSRGVGHDYVFDGRLTPERLKKHELLFINLVSAEREPFLVSEIVAIRRFVEAGGSLLIVTDHSNCYFHSHRLKPLLSFLGIQSFTDTACDVPPHTLRLGNAWLSITNFRPHPVTEGLERLGFQTGGLVDPRYAVALTSSDSWADRWDVGIYGDGNGPGYYGDFERDEQELPGPHGVVLARDFDKGRIVIVADQNMFGDAFLNYADNYCLWLNVMAWLLRKPELADPQPYESWRCPRLVLFEPASTPRFGSANRNDYYNLLCLLTRHYWTFANDRIAEPADLQIVADGEHKFSAQEIDTFRRYIEGNGRMIVLSSGGVDSAEEAPGAEGLVCTLGLKGVERHISSHTITYRVPLGGEIVRVTDGLLLDNDHLPPPNRAPNAEETQRIASFLEIVGRLLGDRKPPP